jgi:GNAT superfamily N-acetyltransferase
VKQTQVAWLADHLDLVPTVAKWLHQEWGHMHPGGGSVDQTAKRVHQRAQRDRIPTAFIALDAGIPIGTACILEYDSAMDRALEEARAADAAPGKSDLKGSKTRSDLTPWLCAVYVVPERRRRGIASKLVRHVMLVAKRMGVEALYLYAETDAAEALYRSLGWQVLERQTYTTLRATIMVAVLS